MRLKPYTKNYMQLWKAGNERSFPQGSTHQLFVQSQKVSPENIHASSIQTDQVLFRNMYIHMYLYIFICVYIYIYILWNICMHVITISRKEKGETLNLKEHREGSIGRFGGRKQKGKCCD